MIRQTFESELAVQIQLGANNRRPKSFASVVAFHRSLFATLICHTEIPMGDTTVGRVKYSQLTYDITHLEFARSQGETNVDAFD